MQKYNLCYVLCKSCTKVLCIDEIVLKTFSSTILILFHSLISSFELEECSFYIFIKFIKYFLIKWLQTWISVCH